MWNEDEKGDHTHVPENQWRTRIHSRVSDRLTQPLKKMGATVDLARTTAHWTTTTQDGNGPSISSSVRSTLCSRSLGATSYNGSTLRSDFRPLPSWSPVSCELGGRQGTQTRDESGGGEEGRDDRSCSLRAAIETTMVRAEADPLIAASTLRRALREGECDEVEKW